MGFRSGCVISDAGRAVLAGLVAIAMGAGLVACQQRSSEQAAGPAGAGTPLRIVATIPPVAGLVEPLVAGAGLPHELITLTPPGVSEHGYEIPPDKLTALARADLVVMAGLGMEPQVDVFLREHPSANRRVVSLGEAAGLAATGTVGAHDDDHADHDHHHAVDPHIWLDPILVRTAVEKLAVGLGDRAAVDASRRASLEASRARLVERIMGVHAAYEAALGGAPRRTIIVAHDAYGYLAARYKLEVVAIAGLNAGEPQPADIMRAVQAIREKHATTIFLEPQLAPAAAERIARATGAKVAVLDPLGSGDWFALMEKNLEALKDALGVSDGALSRPPTGTHPPEPTR